MGMATKKSAPKAKCLLSTDSLSGYGLDLVFQTAKQQGYDGLDLAMRKNFDARQIEYVVELSKKYRIQVEVVQTSRNINLKEMNQAVELARAVGAKVIAINAPEFFNI